MAKEAGDGPTTSPQWDELKRQFEALTRSETWQRLAEIGRRFTELPENHPLKQVGRQFRQVHERWRERERRLIAEEPSDQARREQEQRAGRTGRPPTAIPHWTEAVADLKAALAREPTGRFEVLWHRLHRYRRERARHVLRFLQKQAGFNADLSTAEKRKNYERVLVERLLQEEEAGALPKPLGLV